MVTYLRLEVVACPLVLLSGIYELTGGVYVHTTGYFKLDRNSSTGLWTIVDKVTTEQYAISTNSSDDPSKLSWSYYSRKDAKTKISVKMKVVVLESTAPVQEVQARRRRDLPPPPKLVQESKPTSAQSESDTNFMVSDKSSGELCASASALLTEAEVFLRQVCEVQSEDATQRTEALQAQYATAIAAEDFERIAELGLQLGAVKALRVDSVALADRQALLVQRVAGKCRELVVGKEHALLAVLSAKLKALQAVDLTPEPEWANDPVLVQEAEEDEGALDPVWVESDRIEV